MSQPQLCKRERKCKCKYKYKCKCKCKYQYQCNCNCKYKHKGGEGGEHSVTQGCRGREGVACDYILLIVLLIFRRKPGCRVPAGWPHVYMLGKAGFGF